MRLMWRSEVLRSLVLMWVKYTIRSGQSPIGTRKYNKDAFIIIKNQSRRDLTKSQPNPELIGHHAKETRRETRKTMIQIQLRNLESLLDGEVSHQTLVDHTGKVSYRYTITYQETDGSTP